MPTMYVLSKNKKKYKNTFQFASKNISIYCIGSFRNEICTEFRDKPNDIMTFPLQFIDNYNHI